jgi:hypothetical protein
MALQKSKILDFDAQSGGRAGKNNIDYFYNDYLYDFKPLRSPYFNVTKLVKKGDFKRVQWLILNTYKIGSLEYGNWIIQHRRIDFELSLLVALYDFNKILNFDNNNIGVNGLLNVSFGARGVSSAFAHYEPLSKVINLSRDRRVDKQINPLTGNKIVVFKEDKELYQKIKEQLREQHSGYGSFGHEYGHFLDYIIAIKFIKNRHIALSGGVSKLFKYKNIDIAFNHFQNSIEYANITTNIELSVYAILSRLLFNIRTNAKGEILKVSPTSYYKRLYDFAEKKGDYWIRLNEIWARTFEILIAYKLKKINIVDKFLVKEGKYRDELQGYYKKVYPTFGEVINLIKPFNEFLNQTNKLINKK